MTTPATPATPAKSAEVKGDPSTIPTTPPAETGLKTPTTTVEGTAAGTPHQQAPLGGEVVQPGTNKLVGASADAARENVTPKKAPKRKYLVVGGKTFVRDAAGNEVKYIAGQVVELTEAEALGRAGQVEIYKAEVEAND